MRRQRLWRRILEHRAEPGKVSETRAGAAAGRGCCDAGQDFTPERAIHEDAG